MRTGDQGNVGWRALRAQSDLIAVVLLAGMVIAGATAVVIAGSEALNQGRGDASTTSAVQSMQSLDAKIQQLSQGSSSQDSIGGGANGANFDVVGESPANPVEAGKVKITVDPPSNPATNHEFWLGTVRYEKDDEVVAYQGGGVWRKTGNGSAAVSPPNIQYRTKAGPKTVNFPIVSIDGESAGSEFQVESVERKELLTTLGLSNPIKPGTTIIVEIRSEYYDAWATELKSEFGGKPVTTDPTTKTVTVTLKTPTAASAPSPILGTNAGGSTAMSNHGDIDSYDSRVGTYPDGPSDQAHVMTKGTIDGANQMKVNGDLIAEEGLESGMEMSNKNEVLGRTIFGHDPDIGSGDYLELTGGQTMEFHEIFSTQNNMEIDGDDEFGGVLVDGNFKASGNPLIDGPLVVTGDVEEIETARITGPVYVHGNLDELASGGTVDIDTDVIVYGDVDIDAGTDIDGTLYYCSCSSKTEETGAQIANQQQLSASEITDKLDDGPTPIVPDVPNRKSAEPRIDRWSSLSSASENDNDEEPLIDSTDQFDFSGTSDYTLGAGNYYLEDLEVPSGETLELDTSSGDVVIYVPDNPSAKAVDIDGTIQVTGSSSDHRVRVYVDEDSPTGDEFNLDGSVTVPQDKTPKMWLYFKPSANIVLENGAHYEGVIYGADDAGTGGASIDIGNHAVIYGALIGDVTGVPNHAEIHYDIALEDKRVFTTPDTVAPVGFVHFSQQSATVEG